MAAKKFWRHDLSRKDEKQKQKLSFPGFFFSLIQDIVRNMSDLDEDKVEELKAVLVEAAKKNKDILNERDPLHGETW